MLSRRSKLSLCVLLVAFFFCPLVSCSAEAKSMDVTEALRLMRQAKSSLEAGNFDNSCALYDRVVTRFPTWWMSLVGRVECGLERGDAPDALASMLARAEAYEAPRKLVATLRAKLFERSGKMSELCEILLPDALAGRPVALSLRQLLLFTWLKGRLGDSVRLSLRMHGEGSADAASLRLGSEGALLTKDGESADILLPAFLAMHQDRVLMVRYIRDLQRRGQAEKAEAWILTWSELVRADLPSRLSGK